MDWDEIATVGACIAGAVMILCGIALLNDTLPAYGEEYEEEFF